MRLWLSLLQIVYDKWQVLPRLNQLISGDKDRPSNVNQEMLICAAWTEHEYFSCCRNCVNFCGGQIDLWHTMRLSCISAYFIIVVRRIRAAAIALQKNGNSRKIIRLSSSAITTIPYHTYLKDCCWTPLHQIFLHTPCTKVKVVLEQKNIWMRKGLNALAQLKISYYPCRECVWLMPQPKFQENLVMV